MRIEEAIRRTKWFRRAVRAWRSLNSEALQAAMSRLNAKFPPPKGEEHRNIRLVRLEAWPPERRVRG